MRRVAVILGAVWLVGCGGSTPTTSTTTGQRSHAALLGHNIAEYTAMFDASPAAALRRYGDTFRKLPPDRQKVAMKAAARDFSGQGYVLTQGKAGAILGALGAMREGGP